MSSLDRLKEEIAYFKLWLGVAVVTDVGLMGWLLANADSADHLRIVLAELGVVVLTFGVVILHRQIDQRIARIGKL